MPRLAQLVHGYPPRENAGTEQYARRVADGMRARGWEVLTLAAAPRPGARMYATEAEPGLRRLANNAPYAGLRRAASDPAIDAWIGRELGAFRPDVIHVQHLHALSVTAPLPAPVVWTLHDAWAWCAAGGLLLRDGAPCPGPGPACASCASGWARDPAVVTGALATAGAVSRWIAPDRLHAAWRAVPAGIRDRIARAPAARVTSAHIHARTDAIRAFARQCARILSPSRWLASMAVANGLPEPTVVPHGVQPSGRRREIAPDAPFVFLGTLAPHKGPHLVAAAHRGLPGAPPLRIHGPPGPDAAYVASLPHSGPLAPERVSAVLASARALVLGSVWPENAPLVILEARAVGCPVVAPAIGGIPELVEPGVDGWLYPPGDVEALRSTLAIAMTERVPVRSPPTLADHLDRLSTVYSDVIGGRA